MKNYKLSNIINNLPENYFEYLYIVARNVDGQYWFWGKYNTAEKAYAVAEEIHGVAFYNHESEWANQ